MAGAHSSRIPPVELLLDIDSDIDRFRHGLLPPRAQGDNIMPWSEAAYGSLVNLPRSTKDFAMDTYEGLKHMVKHPVQTATALKDLALGTAQLPIPGEQGKEPIPRALMEMLGERYGGEDAVKQTLHDDPAGMLSDLLMFVPGLGVAGAFRSSTALGDLAKAVPDMETSDRTELLHMLGGEIPNMFEKMDPMDIHDFGVGDLAPGLDGLLHFYEPGSSTALDSLREYGVKARLDRPVTALPEVPDLHNWNPYDLAEAMGPNNAGVLTNEEVRSLIGRMPDSVKGFDVINEHRNMSDKLGYEVGEAPDLGTLYDQAFDYFEYSPDELEEVADAAEAYTKLLEVQSKLYNKLLEKQIPGFRYKNLYEKGNLTGGYSVGMIDPSKLSDVPLDFDPDLSGY